MSKKKTVSRPARKGLVIDSSVALAWCFPDEQDTYSQSVLDALASQKASVPDLWHLEVANTLVVGERGSALLKPIRSLGWAFCRPCRLKSMMKRRHAAFGDTTSLAREHGLSVYGAAYLELAMRRGLPLATLDDKLKPLLWPLASPSTLFTNTQMYCEMPVPSLHRRSGS